MVEVPETSMQQHHNNHPLRVDYVYNLVTIITDTDIICALYKLVIFIMRTMYAHVAYCFALCSVKTIITIR